MEKDFEACFDRTFSQEALEAVGDEDFERFLDDLDSALELDSAGGN
jgi:cyclopropane fatty-acyl-phospholipid synthase-like methyltransferase